MSNIDISTHIQNRNDFIDQFQREHGYTNRSNTNFNLDNNYLNTNNSVINRNRWDYLHDLNKLQQVKLNEKRKLKKKEEENEIMNECTFTPKLNKSMNYENMTLNTDFSKIKETQMLDLINRQELWNQKKKERMDNLKKLEKEREMKQCFFTPEINKENSLNKSHITYRASNLLEDPESYQMYIKRMQKKRDDEINKKKKNDMKPGSGKIWTNKPKKYNIDYDYTKHEISKSNQIKRSKSNKKIDENRKKNENLKKNYNSLDIDKYYEGIYKKNNDFNKDNNFDVNYEDNILFTQAVEYGKAIDILHNQLLSIDLIDEDYKE